MFEKIKKFFTKSSETQKPKPFSSAKYADKDFLKIGEYQLTNLLSNPVKFLLLDLRSQNTNPHLVRSEMATIDSIVDMAKKHLASLDDAVVLVCENGSLSEKAAQKLIASKYRNVVILEEGTQALSPAFQNVKDMYYLLHKKKL